MKALKNYLLSLHWRRKLNQSWKILENSEAQPLPYDADNLWTKIAERLPTQDQSTQKQRPRWKQPAIFLVPALASVVLMFIVNYEAHPTWREKSADSFSSVIPESTLSFATVKANGEINHRQFGDKMHKGDAILFYLETPRLPPNSSFTIDLSVKTPSGQLEEIVSRYLIASPHTPLLGNSGYILYRLEAKGHYDFYGLRTINSAASAIEGFALEALD